MDNWQLGIGQLLPAFGPILILLLLWSLVWKGLALWHSARRAEYIWFIIFLLVNTLGILEVIYLFFVAKIKANRFFSGQSDNPPPHQ